jgi:hypothetical protein
MPASNAIIKWSKCVLWFRRVLVILVLYGIALFEGYYLPRYGIQWMLAGIGATAFLAGLWLRTYWD